MNKIMNDLGPREDVERAPRYDSGDDRSRGDVDSREGVEYTPAAPGAGGSPGFDEGAGRPDDVEYGRDEMTTLPDAGGAELDAYSPSSWTDAEKARVDSIDKLNACLRGELSAVETYELALERVRDHELAGALRQLRDGHDHRVTMIRDWLRVLGVEPARGSGAWGAFAKLVQRGADLLGDRTALSILEEGEDHGLKLYEQDLDACDAETRDFIVQKLLPMQRESHDLCRALFRYAKAS